MSAERCQALAEDIRRDARRGGPALAAPQPPAASPSPHLLPIGERVAFATRTPCKPSLRILE